MYRTTLALALACSASAFMVPGKVPRKLATVRSSIVATSSSATSPAAAAGLTPATPAYAGLKLPYDTGAIEENIMPEVQDLVDDFGAGFAPAWLGPGGILAGGKLKSDPSSLDPLQKFMKDLVPGLNDMPDTYKTFGGGDYAAQVEPYPLPYPLPSLPRSPSLTLANPTLTHPLLTNPLSAAFRASFVGLLFQARTHSELCY